MAIEDVLKKLAAAISNETVCRDPFYEIQFVPVYVSGETALYEYDVELHQYCMPKPIAVKDSAIESEQIDLVTGYAILLRRNRSEFLRGMQKLKSKWYSVGDPSIRMSRSYDGTYITWHAVEAFV